MADINTPASIELALSRFEQALRVGALNAAWFTAGHDLGRTDHDLLRDTASTPGALVARAKMDLSRGVGDRFTDVVSAAAGRLVGYLLKSQPHIEEAEL